MKKRILLLAISAGVSLSFIHSAFADAASPYVVYYNIVNSSLSDATNVTMGCTASALPKSISVDKNASTSTISGTLPKGQAWNNVGNPFCGPYLPANNPSYAYAGLSYTVTINGVPQTKYCPTLKITESNTYITFELHTHQESPNKPPIYVCIPSKS